MSARIDKLVEEVRDVADDAQDLVHETAGAVGEQVRHARDRVERSVAAVRRTLTEFGDEATTAARRTAARARRQAEAHPWATVGLAAAVGIVVGLLIRRR